MEVLSWLLAELNEHNKALQAFYYLAVGVFGAVGIYFLRQRDKAMKKSSDASQKTAETASLQLNIARSSLIVDQYVKSIDQLGNDSDAIKVGGIYGLEQVAKGSSDLRPQIMQVLMAYVRNHAIRPENEDRHRPSEVIQAILHVLGRASEENYHLSIDLSECYLRSYKFDGEFSYSNFREADLSFCDFVASNFRHTNFEDSNCEGLSGELNDFGSARFVHANLTSAYLRGSNFEKAVCINVDFSNAVLSDEIFSKANCENATFSNASLICCDFTGANCRDALFAKTIIIETDFSGAIYNDDSFENSALTDVNGIT